MSITAEDRLLSHAWRVTDPNHEVPERAKRRSYSAKYKLEILAEYEVLDREGKGGLLRPEGPYTSLLSEWRKQRDRGARSVGTKAGSGTVRRDRAGEGSAPSNMSTGWRRSSTRPVG